MTDFFCWMGESAAARSSMAWRRTSTLKRSSSLVSGAKASALEVSEVSAASAVASSDRSPAPATLASARRRSGPVGR